MNKRELERFLREHGYAHVRNNKHAIWENKAGHRIAIPLGSKSLNHRLIKTIIVAVERGNYRAYT